MRLQIAPITFFLFAATLLSCNKIENPIIDIPPYREDLYGPVPEFPSNSVVKQRVLLEDFTGHECGNCTYAHDAARSILEDNSDRVAVIAIHAGTLAAPFLPKYPADYRTPEGTYYLLTQVGSDVLPKGRINRTPNAKTVSNYQDWSAQVGAALQSVPQADLQIISSFESSSNVANIHINTQWKNNYNGNVRLVTLIIENGIIGTQLNYQNGFSAPPDTAYHHEHMLRGSVTGATGIEAFQSPLAGTEKTYSYTYNWNTNWIPENCEVVAFLTNGLDGEVINVAKTKVIP